MAVTSLWKISSNLNNTINYIEDKNKTLKDLDNAIDYAKNKDKTEDMFYITGINCNVKYAKQEMKQVKKVFNKENGILGFHGYQSFKENEVTPELAHEIGVKLANEMWGDKYQVIVSTHLNTNHIHNHFVVNSVSYIDGEKFNSCRATTARLRSINDSLCLEYNLSTIEEKKCSKSGIDFSYYLKKDNYQTSTKKDIDLFISRSSSYSEFINMLENNNYEVTNRYGKLSIRNKRYKRNVRIERAFGDDYSIENIKQRILEEREDYSHVNDEYISFNQFKKKNKLKYGGIISLYKYYCFLLKIYPSKRSKYPSVIQEDVDLLNMYNNVNNLINKYELSSENDFNDLTNNLKIKYEEKYSLRTKLRNEYKVNKDEGVLNKVRLLNQELKELDKEINICFFMNVNNDEINNKVNNLENERKEMIKNESIK